MTLVRRVGHPPVVEQSVTPPQVKEALELAKTELERLSLVEAESKAAIQAIAGLEQRLHKAEEELKQALYDNAYYRHRLHNAFALMQQRRWWPWVRKSKLRELLWPM